MSWGGASMVCEVEVVLETAVITRSRFILRRPPPGGGGAAAVIAGAHVAFLCVIHCPSVVPRGVAREDGSVPNVAAF